MISSGERSLGKIRTRAVPAANSLNDGSCFSSYGCGLPSTGADSAVMARRYRLPVFSESNGWGTLRISSTLSLGYPLQSEGKVSGSCRVARGERVGMSQAA
jgi:hypothetical protein